MSHFSLVVIGPDIADQLAPYDERLETPEGKWDWYAIGGRWSSFFPLKGPLQRWVDQARVEQIDFEAARAEAAENARREFTRWGAYVKQYGTARPWKEFLAKVNAGDLSIKDARREYNSQELIRQFGIGLFMVECPVEKYGFDEKKYMEEGRKKALVPFALLRNGEWIEHNEKDEDEWVDQVNKVYAELAPKTLLTLVDCHT